MDLALKQRLVGATVLVALGVIFIPMLLDGPAEHAGHDAGARIPDPPADQVQTRRLPLNPQAQSEAASREVTGAADRAAQAIPEVVVSEVPRRSAEPPSAAELSPGAADQMPPDVDRKPAEQAVRSAAGSQAMVTAQAAADGRWLLQLGAFADESNARTLVNDLNQAGFPAFRDQLVGGDRVLHRVGVGYWDERETAADVGSRIARAFPHAEISLRRMAEDQSDPGSGDAAVGWMVQVGSFASEKNAAALRDRLRAAGFAAHSDRLRVDDRLRFRVRVGPELERADAEAVQQRLKQEMDINGLVVSHP